MAPDIEIQQIRLSDLETLHKACCEIYTQNFSEHWNEDGLEQYINKVFGIDTLDIELADKNIQYYMAFIKQEPVAFMKINLFSNLPGLDMEKGIELDKIYILPQFKGMKIGKRLLEVAFNIAGSAKKEIFWLSVIDTNREAISFYEKAGFKFHSKTKLSYPKFKEELKGMWRMYLELPAHKTPVLAEDRD
jgi:ribosomal protein S18 acetylase RimI-like enzyme